MTRIAIVGSEKCRPKKCHQECKKSCPVVKLGKLCIEVTNKSKIAFISEPLCIGASDGGSNRNYSFVAILLEFTNPSHSCMLLPYTRLWYLREEVPI